jgi:hydrogenase maturation protein HypF
VNAATRTPVVGLPRECTGVRAARRCLLTGTVQGVGLRPAVHRLATALCLSGEARNVSEGLLIEVEGEPDNIETFLTRLAESIPPAARPRGMRLDIVAPRGQSGFSIANSVADGPPGVAAPTDRAVCSDCLAEVTGFGAERRGDYAFTSCTACGPRYSILTALPYDRAVTSMAGFQMCVACRSEYMSMSDRRFHAETNACRNCGPRVWLTDASGRQLGDTWLPIVRAALRGGRIVGLKGVGGYQLLCDATDTETVRRLRSRKHRPLKPLAVLVGSLKQAEALARTGAAERAALSDPANPIVLCEVRPGHGLAPEVNQGFNTIGLLLPTTPLHWLVADGLGKPLVCTSGNREGDPLETDPSQAELRLGGVCDLWVHHDRPIVRPIDDSVVRVIAGRVVVLRLGRGYAPFPLSLRQGAPALAVGGHQKVALAWSNGAQAVLGAHVGDMETLSTRQRFLNLVTDTRQLYGFAPRRILHDAHPDYFTTDWAQDHGTSSEAVWHHHAHIAAAMVEHGLLDREVLGVTWDGTGYGPDGTVWGGEFLIATARGFRRFARLRPFRLPGGEAAIREPWRVAAVLLRDALGAEAAVHLLPQIGATRVRALLTVTDKHHLSPQTTSAGRLFDAVSALLLRTDVNGFDGRSAMLLEGVADPADEGAYPVPLRHGDPIELDWRPLVAALVTDFEAGVQPAALAMRFHRSLARAIAAVCALRPDLPAVLGGGVFQNRLLVECLVEEWARLPACRGRFLGLPGHIPPNDGGLAAGQLAIGLARDKKE